MGVFTFHSGANCVTAFCSAFGAEYRDFVSLRFGIAIVRVVSPHSGPMFVKVFSREFWATLFESVSVLLIRSGT